MSDIIKMAQDMELVSDFLCMKGRFVGDMVHISIADLAEAIRADIVSEREKKLREAVRDLADALIRIVPYRGRVVYTPTRSYEVNPINTDTVDGCYRFLGKHADTIKECQDG